MVDNQMSEDENQKGWTFDTLKEHLLAEVCSVRDQIKEGDRRYSERFINQEKAVDAALASAKEAVTKAETATEKRFESVNEFRSTLADQAKDFMSRNEYTSSIQSVVDKVEALDKRATRSEGTHAGSEVTWGKMVSLIGVLGTILTIIILLSNNVFK